MELIHGGDWAGQEERLGNRSIRDFSANVSPLGVPDGVRGSHGASIGQLDEETLFYMQARGISEEQAYALMADARIEAVCQKIPDETAQKLVKAYLGGDAADECEKNS